MAREAWLVVIDLQHAFRAGPWATPGFDVAAGHARRLAGAFAGRTVLTRFRPPAVAEGGWRDYYEHWDFARDPGHTQWALVDDFAGAPVVELPTLSKWGAGIEALTGRHPTLVLCGVSTDCCVLMTALAAIDAGARVRVVADACAAEPAAHRAAVEILRRRAPLIAVTTAAEETRPA
jgi:nicotinamidase-related amidase